MTFRLILTRHAKSAWDDPNMDDMDRPLTKRGRKSAKAIGGWMADCGYRPELVLCSPAERTRETWSGISKALAAEPAPEVVYEDRLYGAEPDLMLEILRKATARSVMMVGHNPGSAYFAAGLVSLPPTDSRFERYPTGATTVIDFEIDSWERLIWRKGRVVDFVVPRDLIKLHGA